MRGSTAVDKSTGRNMRHSDKYIVYISILTFCRRMPSFLKHGHIYMYIYGYIGGNIVWRIARKRKKIATGRNMCHTNKNILI